MYKWHQSNNLVYISFNIPSNIGKQDIQADITSSAISLGVKGYGLNCEGTLYSSIKGSKWAIKDGMVQVQMDKQQAGTKWSQLLSEVTESNAKAMVLFEYEPTSDEELALSQNEVINILSKDESGWWEGSKLSLNGVFPSNFVQEYPLDYQPPEDTDSSIEASKLESEQSTMNQVSRVGINMMGSMDELKNKLANRKTATYTPADIEDAVNSNNNNNSNNDDSNNNSGAGFVAVQPSSRGVLQRNQGKVLLNNRASTVLSGTPPAIQPIQPVQPMVQLKPTPKQQPQQQQQQQNEPAAPTTTNISMNSSGNSIPSATTSKESQSTTVKEKKEGKEPSEPSSRITSLFKNPIKKIQSISAFTGSHSHEQEKSDKNNSGTKTKARVVYDFETKEANELNLKKGDIVVVLQKDASGWWQGINQSTQATGWFSNTFVEEIKEVAPPPSSSQPPISSDKQKIKSPPPKIQPSSSSSTSQPQTVEAKLQSLSETPKLETARKAGAARGRKPPSRVRASYLLSEDEKAERDKLKQSFYSHVVSSQKDLGMDDEQEEEEEQQPLQRINPPIEKPSKPAPPKRLPNMNLGGGSGGGAPTGDGPSPPLVSEKPSKPAPPPKANKPTGLSSSDGYEPSSPPNEEVVVQKSPVLTRKFPPTSTSPLSSSNEDAPPPPTGKPPPLKPRAPLPSDSPPPPSHEVNFKANLKSTPKPAISTSQEITNETTTTTATPQQPTPPPLKKVIKPAAQQPPSSNQSSELAEKLNKFSDLAENSAAADTTTTTTPTKQSPPPTTNASTTPVTKPPVRPPLKKPVAGQPAPTSNTTTEETIQPTSPPTLAVNKPKLTPRSGPNSAPPSPNTAPQASTPNSLPPSTHKRNLSNPNTTTTPTPTPTPLQHKKTNSNTSTPLPTFDEIIVEISNICNSIQEQNDNSQDSTTPFKHSYPLLVDSFFSVAVCSTDGQFWGNDDGLNDQCVPMFQAIYPFLYAILCEEIGVDEVSKYIDSQAKPLDNSDQHSKPTNDQKKAHNPFTLSGQLVVAHLFSGKYSNAAVARIYQFLNTIQQLVNSNSVSCDMVSYLSQKSDTGDEVLVGHLLKSSGLLKQPDDILDFFYQLNSIQLNSKQISVLAATLAAEGVCPFSPQLKLAPKSIITKTNDLLKQCNSTSISSVNSFTLNNKLIPILSDSGVLMLIVPGLMGISVVSPTCNNNNNKNNNNNFTHYPNNNHLEFTNKLNSIFNK